MYGWWQCGDALAGSGNSKRRPVWFKELQDFFFWLPDSHTLYRSRSYNAISLGLYGLSHCIIPSQFKTSPISMKTHILWLVTEVFLRDLKRITLKMLPLPPFGDGVKSLIGWFSKPLKIHFLWQMASYPPRPNDPLLMAWSCSWDLGPGTTGPPPLASTCGHWLAFTKGAWVEVTCNFWVRIFEEVSTFSIALLSLLSADNLKPWGKVEL